MRELRVFRAFRSLHESKLFLAETFANHLESGFDGNRRKTRRKREYSARRGPCRCTLMAYRRRLAWVLWASNYIELAYASLGEISGL